MDCCYSTIVLSQPNSKLMNAVTCISNRLSRECLSNNYLHNDKDDDFYKEVSSSPLLAGKDGCQTAVCSPRKVRTCKKIPVKETTSVNCSRHVNGKKKINDYVKEQQISRGSYGKVVLYHNISDGKPYAIKVICKSRMRKMRIAQAETAMSNISREVSIMKMLDHSNVVNLVEVIDDPESDYLYMVLEYVESNDAICNISETTGRVDEKTVRKYFTDIVAGVLYLHNHNIVHGDIKPENLLLTKCGRVKIGDFSVSHAFEDGNDEVWRCPGTPAFTAPECCSGRGYNGKGADTWAVGVTLYYMIAGCYPFLGNSIPDTYDKIVNSPLSLPQEMDPDLKDLLQGLLDKDPMQRTTLNEAAKHPWVVKGGGPITDHKYSCSCQVAKVA